MTKKDEVLSASPKSNGIDIPQYSLPKILFMYAWPLAWFAFLIYVIAPLFLRPDGTLPLWGENLVNFLGHGAELIVALIILRREGYRLNATALRSRSNLRARINWHFPDKAWKWAACVGAFVVAVAAVLLLLPLETEIAAILPPPDWMPDHPLKEASNLQAQSPDMNPVGIAMGFIYGPMGSLPLAIFFHWLGNVL